MGGGGFPEASGNGNCSCRPSAEGLPRTCVASERRGEAGEGPGGNGGLGALHHKRPLRPSTVWFLCPHFVKRNQSTSQLSFVPSSSGSPVEGRTEAEHPWVQPHTRPWTGAASCPCSLGILHFCPFQLRPDPAATPTALMPAWPESCFFTAGLAASALLSLGPDNSVWQLKCHGIPGLDPRMSAASSHLQ